MIAPTRHLPKTTVVPAINQARRYSLRWNPGGDRRIVELTRLRIGFKTWSSQRRQV